MLHDFRLLIIFVFVLIKLSGYLIAADELSSSLTPPPKKPTTRKKETKKFKDHDFFCKLNLMPQQEELLFVPPPESSFDLATGAIDVPKSNHVNYHGTAFDLYLWPKTKDGFVVVPYSIPRGSKFCEYNLIFFLDFSYSIPIICNFQNFKLQTQIMLNLQQFSSSFSTGSSHDDSRCHGRD